MEEIPIGLMKDAITIAKIIEGETTTDKTIETGKITELMSLDKEMETGVKVGIGPENIAMTALEVEIEVETETDKYKVDPKLCQMTEEDQGLDLTQV